MTAICAVVHDKKVWMGGDSAAADVSTLSLSLRRAPKVFVNGPFVMGFTDSFRMGQLLQHGFSQPDRVSGTSDEKYMATSFVDGVRSCLKAGGYARRENEVESGGTFLVGYHGRIFEVHSDYQVGESLADFDAVGSGFELCLGALHATEEMVMEPGVRLVLALRAAERFSMGVRSPFTIAREP